MISFYNLLFLEDPDESSNTMDSKNAYLNYRRTNTLSALSKHYNSLTAASNEFKQEREEVFKALLSCEEYETKSSSLSATDFVNKIYEEHEIKEAKLKFRLLRNAIYTFTKTKYHLLHIIKRYSREILNESDLFHDDQDVISKAEEVHNLALDIFQLLIRSSGVRSSSTTSYGAPMSIQQDSSRTIGSTNSCNSVMSVSTIQTGISFSTNMTSITGNTYSKKEIEQLWCEKEDLDDTLKQPKIYYRNKRNHKKNKLRSIIDTIKKTEGALKLMPEEIKNDPEIVMHAVQKYGCAIQHASTNVKNNKDVVLVALKQNGKALRYVSEMLQNDEEVVLTAISSGNILVVRYASESLLDDKELMLKVVRKDGRSLKYASTHLQNDIDIVLNAVTNHGRALQYASESLRCNEEVVQVAMKQDPYAWKFISQPMKSTLHVISLSAMHLKHTMNDHESFTLRGYISEKVMNSIEFHAYLENCTEMILAAKLGLRWNNAIGDLDGDSLDCLDKKTNLFPFMLAATSDDADLNTIFAMMKKSVNHVRLYNNHGMDDYDAMSNSTCACS